MSESVCVCVCVCALTDNMECPCLLSTLAELWSLRTPSGVAALMKITRGRNREVRNNLRACMCNNISYIVCIELVWSMYLRVYIHNTHLPTLYHIHNRVGFNAVQMLLVFSKLDKLVPHDVSSHVIFSNKIETVWVFVGMCLSCSVCGNDVRRKVKRERERGGGGGGGGRGGGGEGGREGREGEHM